MSSSLNLWRDPCPIAAAASKAETISFFIIALDSSIGLRAIHCVKVANGGFEWASMPSREGIVAQNAAWSK